MYNKAAFVRLNTCLLKVCLPELFFMVSEKECWEADLQALLHQVPLTGDSSADVRSYFAVVFWSEEWALGCSPTVEVPTKFPIPTMAPNTPDQKTSANVNLWRPLNFVFLQTVYEFRELSFW